MVPINDESGISFGANFGYGVFKDKRVNTRGTFEANKVYSTKVFIKFDYKNFIINLSLTTNRIFIYSKINTENEGVKSVTDFIDYNTITLGLGRKFVI